MQAGTCVICRRPQWTIGAALLDVPLITVGGGERSSTSSSSGPIREAGGKGGGEGNGEGSGGANGAVSRCGEGSRARMLACGAQSSDDAGCDVEAAVEAPAEMQLQQITGDRISTHEIDAVPQGGTDSANSTSDAPSTWPASSTAHRGCGGGSCWQSVRATAGRVASPPIYGICAGLAIALLPPLHALLVGGGEAGGDEDGQGGSAPFSFFLQVGQLEHTLALALDSTPEAWRATPGLHHAPIRSAAAPLHVTRRLALAPMPSHLLISTYPSLDLQSISSRSLEDRCLPAPSIPLATTMSGRRRAYWATRPFQSTRCSSAPPSPTAPHGTRCRDRPSLVSCSVSSC